MIEHIQKARQEKKTRTLERPPRGFASIFHKQATLNVVNVRSNYRSRFIKALKYEVSCRDHRLHSTQDY